MCSILFILSEQLSPPAGVASYELVSRENFVLVTAKVCSLVVLATDHVLRSTFGTGRIPGSAPPQQGPRQGRWETGASPQLSRNLLHAQEVDRHPHTPYPTSYAGWASGSGIWGFGAWLSRALRKGSSRTGALRQETGH